VEPAQARLTFQELPKILEELAVVVVAAPGIVAVAKEEELTKTLATVVEVEEAVFGIVAVALKTTHVVVVAVVGKQTDRRMQLMPSMTVLGEEQRKRS